MIVNLKNYDNWVNFNDTGLSNPTTGIFRATSTGTYTAFGYPVPIEKNFGGKEVILNISFEARLISGSYGTVAVETGDRVDMSTVIRSTVDDVSISNTQWEQYSIRAIYPVTINQKLGLITFGVKAGVTATVEFRNMMVETVEGVAQGKPEMIACGMIIKSAGGQPSLNTTFPYFGIESLSFNGTDTVTVTLSSSSVHRKRPFILATGTPDIALIPLVGGVTAALNTTFQLKFTNGTSIQNINNSVFYVFISVFI